MATEKAKAPGLHAIVIGVNNYPHLPTGTGPGKRNEYGKLNQLVSPALSAQAISSWLLNEREASQIKLRSLHLLSSSAIANAPTGDIEFAHAAPTINNVAKAIRKWKSLGDKSAENVLLFYFCGHGFRFGQTDSLLCQDFGQKTSNHFKGALDVQGLLLGMQTCNAQRQLYFFDACRTDMTDFMRQPYSCGEAVINPTGLLLQPGRQIALWASTPRNKAYGYLDGRASVFAEGVIAAFRGAAARPAGNGFEINTSRLKEAIDEYTRARGKGVDQVVHLDHAVRDFAIADLSGNPIVPVSVACRDATLHKEAKFLCAATAAAGSCVMRRDELHEESWDFEVLMGQYDFTAHFDNNNSLIATNEQVQPPYRRVLL